MNLSSIPAPCEIIRSTQLWVERVVVGLQLCPFAKPVMNKELIRYVVCQEREQADVIDTLDSELLFLNDVDPSEVETTLLVLPRIEGDFLDFHFLVDACRKRLKALRLNGVMQLADFHPRYEFAGSEPKDPANATNRSPYPTLHLLREDSIERARSSALSAQSIVERNQALLRGLGWAGINDILVDTEQKHGEAH